MGIGLFFLVRYVDCVFWLCGVFFFKELLCKCEICGVDWCFVFDGYCGFGDIFMGLLK